jgi:hypothetical protein
MRMRAISEAITAPGSTDAVKVIEQQLATLWHARGRGRRARQPAVH